MKLLKRIAAFFLAAVLVVGCVATAWAVSVTVKYKIFVYTDEIYFQRYNYVDSTTPTIQNVTILADSNLGSGSALYHVKYVGSSTIAYCIQPGVKADDSNNYVQGSNGAWYNLPAEKQSAVALAMAMGYPAAEYGTAYGDSNDSNTIMAEKYAATQAVIWGIISEYIDPYDFYDWYNPFYDCVDTDQYPTFALWYDEILSAMRDAIAIPSFCEAYSSWCDPIELNFDAASGNYKASVYDNNGVLSGFNFAKHSGSGITFSQSGNTLNITATPAAVQTMNGSTKTYSTTGSAVSIDPNAAVLCYYDSTGKYQALGTYTYNGLDPMLAYLKIKATPAKSALEITKTDALTGAALAGAGYKLFNSSGTEVASGTTNSSGKLSFTGLTPGQYSYQETTAPNGYVLDSTKYSADLSSAGATVKVSRTNTPAKVALEISKSDAETGSALAGAGYKLFNASGTEVASGTTNANGKLTFNNLNPGQYSYQEYITPSGYALDSTKYSINLAVGSGTVKVSRTNTPLKASIEITKTDADTGLPLAGAGYKLFNAAGTVVDSGTTDSNGKLTFSNHKLGQYTYQEYLVPDGYILDATRYPVDLSTGNVTVKVARTNEPMKASITVNKINAGGTPLSGVTVLLQSSADGGNTWSTVGEKSTGTDGKAVFEDLSTKLTYRLTETATVEGCTLMGDILYQGNLPENGVYDATITAVNDVNLQLPFTGGAGFVVINTLSMLMIGMSFIIMKKKEIF